MDLLEVKEVVVRYDQAVEPVLNGINLKLNRGEIVSVLGASGCGKTTLLRVIQGLLTVERGQVQIRGDRVLGPDEKLVPGQEGIATVHQDFQLQEGLTIENNLKHELIHLTQKDKEQFADRILNTCQLDAIKHMFPREISGGQKQKLALAKALVNEPDLILLDEPFSNLDNISKSVFKEVIYQLKKEGLTFLYVTHDAADAIAFADRVMIMEKGQIVLNEEPAMLHHEISTLYQAQLLGMQNVFSGAFLTHLLKEDFRTGYHYFIPSDAIMVNEEQGMDCEVRNERYLGQSYSYELVITNDFIIKYNSNYRLTVDKLFITFKITLFCELKESPIH